MKLTHLLVCAAVVPVFAAGCGSSTPEGPAPVASAAPAPSAAPVAVETAPVEERQVPVVIRATGTFVPDESSDVTPQVAGTVTETLVHVGDVVKAGAVIVKLDDRDARIRLSQVQAALQQAEAEAARARLEVQRNAELAKSGDVSRASFDRLTAQVAIAEATVAQARAQIAAAEKAVGDTIVRAPFTGHVSARPVAVGEYVSTSVKLVTLVRIQPIKLNLQVPESDAARLRVGMPVEVTVPAHEKALFRGTVGALNVAIDPNSRSMTVEARLPNGDGRLTPGMFGSAEIRLPASEKSVFVPASAVTKLANGDASIAYVINEGQARVTVLQADETLDGQRRVRSGLAVGQTVATTALDKLFDGAPVTTSHAQAR
jgi:RND family efflux transporter MFP subunit